MEWISVKDRLPTCDTTEYSFGVPVLVWPTTAHRRLKDNEDFIYPFAFYGMRVKGDEACFYLHGKEIHGVTDWKPLPGGPKE